MNENENQILAIEMRGVNVGTMRDPTFIVLENVDWSVVAGEFWVVAGTQHSGKSDLLMLAAGLMTPASGSYKLFGRETKFFGEAELSERLRAGFIFAGGQLFNQLTIAENVALPLRYRKNLSAVAAAADVKLLLELMELSPIADVTPINVAVNWRARAALARALILRPEILLLDNPQGGLHARHLQWWLRFLEQLNRGHEFFGGKPMTIVVTADDLRPWENAQRKFALLRDQKFIPLGSWNEVAAHDDEVVKELLSVEL
jgi:ABC-type transporter Mla maintaining outer membrane lipid asymmetry ATPase subunit MlaF